MPKQELQYTYHRDGSLLAAVTASHDMVHVASQGQRHYDYTRKDAASRAAKKKKKKETATTSELAVG